MAGALKFGGKPGYQVRYLGAHAQGESGALLWKRGEIEGKKRRQNGYCSPTAKLFKYSRQNSA